ncbi:flagellar assembly protein FliH [Alkalicoccus chagannorensis]|uniref:flagellar assembly protein FliH n=1 Tax=Alkalicoccus chagannorensis TaxID=427072 RepID=UPI00042014D1|nr:flagellar assembly protein FliH [Alkalicoccus chagannorensis]
MSKLIKSPYVRGEEEKKLIRIKTFAEPSQTEETMDGSDLEEQRPGAFHDDELERLQVEEQELQKKEAELVNWQEQLEQERSAMKEAGEREAEERFRQAAEQGFEEGFQQGVQEAQQQVDSYLKKATDIVDASRTDYYEKISQAEEEMLELAVAVAERIIGERLQQDNSWLSFVRQAVTEVRDQSRIHIFVHPFWYEETLKHQDELKEAAVQAEELVIYPDGSLQENGCIIDTPFGKLEASLDTQLLELKRLLSAKLKAGEGNEA